MNGARIPARIVCPDCRKIVRAEPVDGGYRMRAHTRPADGEHPYQTCTCPPLVRDVAVEYEPR